MTLSGSDYMKHDIRDLGFRVLNKVPDVIKDYKPSEKDTVIHTGGMVSIYNFMTKAKDIKTQWMSSHRDDTSEWSGCFSYESYLKLLNEGDENIIRNIKDMTNKRLKELHHKYKDSFRGYKFDVEGQFFDIGKVLEGVPEVWLTPDPNEHEKPRITIRLDLTFASKVKPNEIIDGSSRVLSIVKFLEEHGVEVRLMSLVIVKNYRNDNRSNILMITDIKDFSEKINYAKVSALVSPTFLRRGFFRVAELVAGNSLNGDYGQVENKLEGFVRVNIKSDIDRLENNLLGGGK